MTSIVSLSQTSEAVCLTFIENAAVGPGLKHSTSASPLQT